jgi:beta-mannosidase
LLAQDRIWLIFDGLDTLAEVSLNGKRLGEAENAFRTYQWEVRDLLHPGVNQVKIICLNPL